MTKKTTNYSANTTIAPDAPDAPFPTIEIVDDYRTAERPERIGDVRRRDLKARGATLARQATILRKLCAVDDGAIMDAVDRWSDLYLPAAPKSVPSKARWIYTAHAIDLTVSARIVGPKGQTPKGPDRSGDYSANLVSAVLASAILPSAARAIVKLAAGNSDARRAARRAAEAIATVRTATEAEPMPDGTAGRPDAVNAAAAEAIASVA